MIGLAQDAITCGIRNLLNDCADLKAGDDLLIIHEDPSLGWYDEEAPKAVAREARALGMNVRFLKVGAPGNEPDPTVEKAMESADCSLFFARIGDQDRFDTASPARKKVMCYARKAASLASPFGTTPHAAMLALKEAVNIILRQTKQVEITCALGTRIGGPVHKSDSGEPEDVTMLRFPVGVPMP
ncbi:MAG: hypothetical protein P1V34_06805, partial [Alphaproteobacteria bacterium]|nr:hypothetical protein [Alphaproteobacteria bacterium]